MRKLPRSKPVKKLPPKKLTAEQKAEQIRERRWNQVDKQTHTLITEILNHILPVESAITLPEEMDVEYRTLLLEIQDRYEEEDLPSQQDLAEEVVMNYGYLLMKRIIGYLKDYSGYEDSYFTNLTEE